MRILGAQEYGTVTTALAIGFIATALADLGATRFSIREIASDRTQAPKLFTNFGALRIGTYFLTFFASLMIGFWIDYGVDRLSGLAYATIYAICMNMMTFLRGMYQAYEDLKLEAFSLIVEKLLVICGGTIGLLITGSATGTLAGLAAGLSATAILNLAWINRKLIPFVPRLFDPTYIRQSIPSILPLGLFGFLGVIYLRIDLIMIEALAGTVQAGQYATAFRVHEASFIVPSVVVMAATFPKLSSLFGKSDFDNFKKLIVRASMGSVLVAVFLAIPISLASSEIIALLDPDPLFAPAAGAISLLIWSLPMVCLNAVLYSALIVMSREMICVIVLVILSLINISMNYFLISDYGIAGAAISTLLCEVLLSITLAGVYIFVRPKNADYVSSTT